MMLNPKIAYAVKHAICPPDLLLFSIALYEFLANLCKMQYSLFLLVVNFLEISGKPGVLIEKILGESGIWVNKISGESGNVFVSC